MIGRKLNTRLAMQLRADLLQMTKVCRQCPTQMLIPLARTCHTLGEQANRSCKHFRVMSQHGYASSVRYPCICPV